MMQFVAALCDLYTVRHEDGNTRAGQGLVEYSLILALIVIVAIGGVMIFGGGVNGLWGRIHSSMPWNN